MELYFTSCCHLKSRVLRLPLATCPSKGEAIRHFHISHNAPYLPPQILHNLCFSFLLSIKAVPREIENNAYAIFFFGGGGGE